ncbi:methylated-DNA--[protein]-cysteine S-methyltransferase [Azospirillum brasilense]|uniref:methylated-DNA--[protein]-cysteine S-methyltransferase n=1 Tax=Azospirillum brasilense TaxID=192 RepID=UPI000E68E8B8|nr:bifunctional helix-turn-helix domain-containing protein/methylated-DNA--[protein]-cysteine S-methyltransferase [Azospirillum brasilense]NUB28430.1 methylated-DNA--[protein]-cysteine S-methyltransferase [Azospirillum brasilense]NUB35616.1 methylated-DNA--[protein]-cysteine S-methyltransferase [Azospirillum brasilense]RIV96872.1 methylated-DNA--[protein]-cysteine S-methyltransferase [Azospirillum brasilense]
MPCLNPAEDPVDARRHRAIAAAIRHLVDHWQDQPGLDELAAVAGMSPFHFQRLFTQWAGISPKRFLQFLTLDNAKRLLAANQSVLDVALDVGLSGPSRLHDLFVACEAMTPGEYKALGGGLTIRWGLHSTPFGPSLVAATERGVCWLSFAEEEDGRDALAEMAAAWPAARLVEDADATRPVAARAFRWDGFAKDGSTGGEPLRLLMKGTNFQIKVWEALLRIPSGAVVSYEDVARAIGQPTAMRAVGAAVGRNPVCVLIPCHRVIQKSGIIHNYRYGIPRKRALLAWEQGHVLPEDEAAA